MKKIISLIFLFCLFCAAYVGAQDYFLTADKNATPLRLNSFGQIGDILKAQGKDKKYQAVLLDMREDGATFVLAPLSFRQEISDDSIILTDKATPGFSIEIRVKKGASIDDDITEFKDELSEIALPVSQKNILLNDRPVVELVLAAEQSRTLFYTYFINYGGDIRFSVIAPVSLSSQYAAIVRDIAASLGTIQIKGAPSATATAATATPLKIAQPVTPPAKPAKKEENKKVVKEPPLQSARPAVPIVPVVILDVKQEAAKGGKSRVKFSTLEHKYSFEVPSAVKASLEEGRLLLKTTAKGKNVFFMEVPGAKSKDYYEAALKNYGEGKTFKEASNKKAVIAGREARVSRKVGLNKAAVNYFIKPQDSFVITFIGDSGDERYLDGLAQEIIKTLRPE